jgi:hypothetical protein
LRKLVRQLWDLDTLSSDDRVGRATELLNDIQEKQAACNKVVGLSFKDIDKVLKAIINEKKPGRSDEDDEREQNPDKWSSASPSIDSERATGRHYDVGDAYSPEDVAWFLAQKDRIIVEESNKTLIGYKSYTPAQVDALLKGDCHPSIFKRKS